MIRPRQQPKKLWSPETPEGSDASWPLRDTLWGSRPFTFMDLRKAVLAGAATIRDFCDFFSFCCALPWRVERRSAALGLNVGAATLGTRSLWRAVGHSALPLRKKKARPSELSAGEPEVVGDVAHCPGWWAGGGSILRAM